MVTKKGIALTVAIIGGFVGASFLVYLIPDFPQSDFITFSDAGEQLNFAMDRNQLVIDEFQTVYRLWENGDIDKKRFNSSTNVSLEQVNLLILELQRKQIPSEWNQSYFLFIQALENYKVFIEQTKEYVDSKSADQPEPADEHTYLETISETLKKAQNLTQESIGAMP
ncbi:MAG: hypothetical protein ACE5KA_00150 [Nitrososphaerales archaeon]